MTAGAPSATFAPARAQRRGLVLAALTFVYVLNFLDRQLIGILAKPIQDELGVSDAELGLIGGLYFAMFYCFIAIPVGWLADRLNRVSVLSGACAIWSAATVACGLSANYPQLVAARMLVGIGEAGGVPPSYAIITDTFPPGQRVSALGVFNLGPAIGAALGVAFGAAVAEAQGWRLPFILVGAIGVVTALLVRLFLRDPIRGGLDGSVRRTGPPAAFAATVRQFATNRLLMLAALGGGATQFVTYGLGNFAVLFLMREKGMALADVAIWYALVIALGMGGSMLLSGRLIDRLVRRSRVYYALAPAVSLLVAMPFFVAFVLVPGWPLALALLLVVMLFSYAYLSASVALVQEEVQPDQRALSGAMLLLVMNFIGLGLGPTWVGWASDWFSAHGDAHGMQTALLTLTPVCGVAIALFLALARRLKQADAA
jgi:MFS family permease